MEIAFGVCLGNSNNVFEGKRKNKTSDFLFLMRKKIYVRFTNNHHGNTQKFQNKKYLLSFLDGSGSTKASRILPVTIKTLFAFWFQK